MRETRLAAVTIRQVSAMVEAEEVAQVLIPAHAAAGTLSPRFQPDAIRARVHDSLCPRGSGFPTFFVARREGGAALGCVAVAPSFCSSVGWELGYLAVLPMAQGQGVARMLVDEAVAFVEAQVPAPAFLLVRAARPGLFERVGFCRMGGAARGPCLLKLDF